MIFRQMVQATFAIFAAAAMFAACGTDAPPTGTAKYCELRCTCEKCSSSELASCNDDINNFQDEARGASCSNQFNTYLTCLTSDAECADGAYDDSFCFNEETDVRNCINPPACASTNDGICDEPAPLGNGKCPAGSDKTDCGGSSECPTTNNGTCDEPQGTGTCPAGTDTADCGGGTCQLTNNGICDEPGGTGECPPGTDTIDCMCASKGDGICDEPQGTGKCAPGTDPVDCGTPVCETTNDGVCDEPQGTGTCPTGTDTADCSTTCNHCADYIVLMSEGQPPGTLCQESVPFYQDFMNCACNAGCKTQCGTSLCVGSPPSSTCGTCIQTGACSSQFGACAGDVNP